MIHFQLSFLTSSPIVRSLPAAHHGEVCDYPSSVGSYCSQYITISSSFIDVFLPSSPHNTSIHRALRRLCYRRCLIAETYPSEAIIVAFQCLPKKRMLSFRYTTVSSSSFCPLSPEMSTYKTCRHSPDIHGQL